jgi:DNA (cytosine-5)-methyltransferase 1
MSLTTMDLFAGCGGFAQGFGDSGPFETALAIESDERAAATYEANIAAEMRCERIEDVRDFPEVDVVIGGPPCQGFSALNMRGVGLERRRLWREYLRVIEKSRPSAFVMENVPQLLRSAEYRAFERKALSLGFELTGAVLNSADYGVAQVRRRAFVIGSKLGKPELPVPTHGRPDLLQPGCRTWPTVRDAIGDLPIRPSGRNWHNPRNPTEMSLERYRAIPGEGEGRFELAERRPDITPPCWLKKKTGSTDVFGRLWWDRPAVTIRTEFYKPEKGRYLHPSAHRPITVREAARLMSFEDDFIFPEDQSMTSVARQIGNAVPPQLARHVAESLVDHLECGRSGRLVTAA